MWKFGSKKNEEEKQEQQDVEAYLMTVDNEMELEIVEGILRAENIIYIVQDNGSNRTGGIPSYLTGFTSMGIDILVSREDLERAKEAVHKNELPTDQQDEES